MLPTSPGWWALRQSPGASGRNSRPPAHPWQRRGLAIAILLLCALCLLLPQTGLGGALFVAGGWLLAMALALPDVLRAVLGRLRSVPAAPYRPARGGRDLNTIWIAPPSR